MEQVSRNNLKIPKEIEIYEKKSNSFNDTLEVRKVIDSFSSSKKDDEELKKEIENEDGSKSKFFCASCYIEPPQNSGLEVFGKEEESFPASDDIPQKILDWLNERIGKYSCIGQ